MSRFLGATIMALLALSLSASSVAAAHAVYRHKYMRVPSGNPVYIDLDKGTTGTSMSSTTREFEFRDYNKDGRYLANEGSAVWDRMDAKPTYAACKAEGLETHSFNLAAIEPGTWFCVKTQQGRFARLSIQVVFQYSSHTGFDILFDVWEK